jgi:hypothetical protein
MPIALGFVRGYSDLPIFSPEHPFIPIINRGLALGRLKDDAGIEL